MYRNPEGYSDPTAGNAIAEIGREERRVEFETAGRIAALMKVINAAANLAGFDIAGRIALRDRKTGKEYR